MNIEYRALRAEDKGKWIGSKKTKKGGLDGFILSPQTWLPKFSPGRPLKSIVVGVLRCIRWWYMVMFGPVPFTGNLERKPSTLQGREF